MKCNSLYYIALFSFPLIFFSVTHQIIFSSASEKAKRNLNNQDNFQVQGLLISQLGNSLLFRDIYFFHQIAIMVFRTNFEDSGS